MAKVKADGTTLVYAGYVGGAGSDTGFAVAVDGDGDLHLGGRTFSDGSTFPLTVGPRLTFGGDADAFVAKLSAKPDLAESAVSFSPSAVKRGGKLSIQDSATKFLSLETAGPSTTRYYLSTDAIKSANDILLTGSRAVPSLAPGAASIGAATVTVPITTPLGAYHVIACADDLKKVVESNETNNCFADPNLVQVALPDLSANLIGNPPGTLEACSWCSRTPST